MKLYPQLMHLNLGGKRWWVLGTLIVSAVTLRAEAEMLPLPVWEKEVPADSVVPSVLPASLTRTKSQEPRLEAASAGEDLEPEAQLKKRVPPVQVDRAFRLFLPESSASSGDTLKPSEFTHEGSSLLSRELVLRRLASREQETRLVYFGEALSEAECMPMARFAKYMEMKLGLPLCVFVLDADQELESGETWKEVLSVGGKFLEGRDLVLVVGNRMDFLRLSFLDPTPSVLSAEDWREVVDTAIKGVRSGSPAAQIEQVLTVLTSESLKRMELRGVLKPPVQVQPTPAIVLPPAPQAEVAVPEDTKNVDVGDIAPRDAEVVEVPSYWDQFQQEVLASPLGAWTMLGMAVLALMGVAWSRKLQREALENPNLEPEDPLAWFGDQTVDSRTEPAEKAVNDNDVPVRGRSDLPKVNKNVV